MNMPYGQNPWEPPTPGAPPTGPPPPGSTPAGSAPAGSTPPGAPPPWQAQQAPQPWGANPWQPAGAPAGWGTRPNDRAALVSCGLGILSVLTLPVAAAAVDGNRPAFIAAALLPGAAVITGHLARRRLRADSERGGSGLALAGLACAWPVLAILALVLVFQPDVTPGRVQTLNGSEGFSVPAPQTPQEGVPTRPDAPLQDPGTARGILTGTVRGLDGELVAGATVTVRRAQEGDRSDSPPCPLTTTTTTGPDGQWFLPLCQLGEGLGWSVEIRKGGLGASTPLAYVNSGRTTTYDVRLAQVF